MHPDLIRIFGFPIAWYGVLITLGVLVGSVIATRMAERRGLNANLMSDLIVWTVLWGVIGSRVFYILTSPDQFRGASFVQLINIRQGGISIHGGIIFGLAVIAYYQWRYKINFYRYADLMVPGVALGIIGGRLGNFFNGADTMGRVTGWPIGWTWPKDGSSILGIFNNPENWRGMPGLCSVDGVYHMMGTAECFPVTTAGLDPIRGPVHLTQIYGVIIGIVLVIAAFYWLRSKRPGWAMWQFVLWYSLLRAGIEETFRLNPLWWKVYLSEGPGTPGIGLFTATQLFSIPLIILAIIMLVRLARSPIPPTNPVPVPVGSGGPSNLAAKAQKPER
jgi:phosphatidylglycerol:prolipoprotein diacylglycerol transferase